VRLARLAQQLGDRHAGGDLGLARLFGHDVTLRPLRPLLQCARRNDRRAHLDDLIDWIDCLEYTTYANVGRGGDKAGSAYVRGKDWGTLAISTLALMVAALTAYFTIVKQQDDLNAIVDGTLNLRANDDVPGKPKIEAWSNQKITITNSGNRTASIREISLRIASSPQDGDCFFGSTALPFDMHPTLLKPGDIWTNDLLFYKNTAFPAGYNGAFFDLTGTHNENPIRVSACLVFNIVTPGDSPREFVQALFVGQLPRRSPTFFLADKTLYRAGTPISILSRNRLVFW
jgi:hypothetical protein